MSRCAGCQIVAFFRSLRAATASVILRRRKADVLELPPKEIVRLEIPLIGGARERYPRVWGEHVARAKALRSVNGFRRFTGAKAPKEAMEGGPAELRPADRQSSFRS